MVLASVTYPILYCSPFLMSFIEETRIFPLIPSRKWEEISLGWIYLSEFSHIFFQNLKIMIIKRMQVELALKSCRWNCLFFAKRNTRAISQKLVKLVLYRGDWEPSVSVETFLEYTFWFVFDFSAMLMAYISKK